MATNITTIKCGPSPQWRCNGLEYFVSNILHTDTGSSGALWYYQLFGGSKSPTVTQHSSQINVGPTAHNCLIPTFCQDLYNRSNKGYYLENITSISVDNIPLYFKKELCSRLDREQSRLLECDAVSLYETRRFGETYRPQHKCEKNHQARKNVNSN
jgi:hypothetical protein